MIYYKIGRYKYIIERNPQNLSLQTSAKQYLLKADALAEICLELKFKEKINDCMKNVEIEINNKSN